jgi:hypothetical protein
VGLPQIAADGAEGDELGWVAFWICFIIFLFSIFIPTVNRALNP